jgi:hypothetical protein
MAEAKLNAAMTEQKGPVRVGRLHLRSERVYVADKLFVQYVAPARKRQKCAPALKKNQRTAGDRLPSARGKTKMKLLTPAAVRALFGACGFGGSAAVALAAALAVIPASAIAAAKVSGSARAVRVETQNASIEEVLTALRQKFAVRYRSSVDLKTPISGTYGGTLAHVVARILEGHNFIVKSSPAGIEVTVLGTQYAPAARDAHTVAKGRPAPQTEPRLPTAPSQVAQQPDAAAPHMASGN